MALTGLDIYKLLPKTNCKDCGCATCLAFAMALAQKKTSLDKCPHVSEQSKQALESASQPPIRLLTIGDGPLKREIGNETVMYRHEQKFHHPTVIGILIDDTLTDEELNMTLSDIGKLNFERVGQRIGVDMIYIKNASGYRNKMINVVRKVIVSSDLNIGLAGTDVETISEAIKLCSEKRPLLVCESISKLDAFIKLAKKSKLSLAINASDLEVAVSASEKAKAADYNDLVINLTCNGITKKIQQLTYARRSALKGIRSLGYPLMVLTESNESDQELAEAASYIAKYASIVIINSHAPEIVFPLLVVRQDIYQDPQKPVQVEPGVYEVGKVTRDSPLLVTTNFSITYFTVAGEVEASKVPAYILCCEAEGMSVLTAWAAEKFTAESISQTLQSSKAGAMVAHKKVIIPGYVAVLSGKLQEASSWKVDVGPKEASGISAYLRSWKA